MGLWLQFCGCPVGALDPHLNPFGGILKQVAHTRKNSAWGGPKSLTVIVIYIKLFMPKCSIIYLCIINDGKVKFPFI